MTTPPNSPVAIHGASGMQGNAIVQKFLAEGFPVRALTRSGMTVSGADATVADFSDQESLVAAYAGARTVVVTLPLVFDAATAQRQAENVLLALEAASVDRAVLLTNGPLAAGPTGNPFVDARARVADGLQSAVREAHVVGVSGIYMQNLTAPWSIPLLNEGTVVYPLPVEAPVPWLSMNDVADRVVDALTAGSSSESAVVGPEALTGTAVSQQLSRHFGPVAWRTVTPDEYADLLRPHVGSEAADGISGMYASAPYAARDLQLSTGTTTLADYLAREWRTSLSTPGRSGRQRTDSLRKARRRSVSPESTTRRS